jgi:hypothetical protein
MNFLNFLATKEAAQRSRGNVEQADRLKAAIDYLRREKYGPL